VYSGLSSVPQTGGIARTWPFRSHVASALGRRRTQPMMAGCFISRPCAVPGIAVIHLAAGIEA